MSTITSGKDGVIKIGGGGAELPKVLSWTLNATGGLAAINTQTMASFSGSSGSSGSDDGEFDVQEVTAKAWTVEVEIFWQKTAAGASPLVDATDIGSSVAVELLPTDTGHKFTGDAYLSNVGKSANTGDKIKQTLTLLGTGALSKVLQ